MSIKIGLVGAPNKGKSTFFSAITKVKVPIAPYPFTTISPNIGIAKIPINCVCNELKVKCSDPSCDGRIRYIPIEVVDVAGLVEGAHLGRGMGNKFLDDLIKADGFIQIIDSSGTTDNEGKETENFPIKKELVFLREELVFWLEGIIKKTYAKFKLKSLEQMQKELSGLRLEEGELKLALEQIGININRIELNEEQILLLAKRLIQNKPIVVAANKIDKQGAKERIENFIKENKEWLEKENITIVPTSADYEYSLVLAQKNGIIDYRPASKDFKIKEDIPPEQKKALEKIKEFVNKNSGTGVYEVLRKMVFEKLQMIVVYPVEDENKYTDSAGRVLPDAFLIKKGTKIIEFAPKVHSDFAKYFVGAIDAKNKKNLSKEYIINNNDVIRLIASKRG
jgi:ribosome-binding ATPase YchF (GTP1/OBG family)